MTVITKNEAADIGRTLASVAWADEIIVVDSGSTDDTVSIARQHTDKVIVREWPGYAKQKNHAASLASHDWILSVDADELVTPELAAEIRQVLATDPAHAGFRIPRVTWHLGRWVRTTDWYPDYQTRLYDRRAADWAGQYVHESVKVRGTTGQLHREFQHFAYRDISDHLETIDRYTTYAAVRCTKPVAALVSPTWRSTRPSHFFATTSRAAASATASRAWSSRRSTATTCS